MSEPKLEIPLTLEVGAPFGNPIRNALVRSDYGVIYSNAVFRLINSTCAAIVNDPPDDVQEIINDIGYACNLGIALNNSIAESLLPFSSLAADFEQSAQKGGESDEQRR